MTDRSEARTRRRRLARPRTLIPGVALALVIAMVPVPGAAHDATYEGTILTTIGGDIQLQPEFWMFQAGGCKDTKPNGYTMVFFDAAPFRGHRVHVTVLQGPVPHWEAWKLHVALSTFACQSVEALTDHPSMVCLAVWSGKPCDFVVPSNATWIALMNWSWTIHTYSAINIAWRMTVSEDTA